MVLCPRPPPESASSSICFSHFCQWRQKAHSSLRNTAFFPNCSGLLRCIKQGSHQFTTIFTTSGNASARVSFRKHGSASGRVYGMDQIAEQNWNNFFFIILFILEIVKIRRSLYAHFNFMNLRIYTDVLSPMTDTCMGPQWKGTGFSSCRKTATFGRYTLISWKFPNQLFLNNNGQKPSSLNFVPVDHQSYFAPLD